MFLALDGLKCRITHISTSDRVGIEILEFKTSVFHFCVQEPDVEGLFDKVHIADVRQQQCLFAVGLGKYLQNTAP
jgi:hypothetical protein